MLFFASFREAAKVAALYEDAFGDKSGLSDLKTFDAFRKYISNSCIRLDVLICRLFPVRLFSTGYDCGTPANRVKTKLQRRQSRLIPLPPIVVGNGRSSFSSSVLFLLYLSYEPGGQAPNLIISASNEV